MIKTQLTVFILALCLTLPVLADQAAYIAKADAERAVSLLKNVKRLKSYCAPCDDKVAQEIAVSDISSADVNFEGYWEVRVNGKGEDLAYLYFLDNGRWRNVAITLTIPVQDVPEYLNDSQL